MTPTLASRALATLKEHASVPGGLLICVEPAVLEKVFFDVENMAKIDGALEMLERLAPCLGSVGLDAGKTVLADLKAKADAAQKRIDGERVAVR